MTQTDTADAMPPHARSLGNRLTRFAYRRRLTDAEVAARSGISRAQLNRIRNRRALPRVRTALALASALACRVADLFFLERDP